MNVVYCFAMWYFVCLIELYENCNVFLVSVFKLHCEL